MPHRYPIPDFRCMTPTSHMHNAIVLNRYFVANTDVVHVAAQHSSVPQRAPTADVNVADDRCGFRNKRIIAYARRRILKRPNNSHPHRLSYRTRSKQRNGRYNGAADTVGDNVIY